MFSSTQLHCMQGIKMGCSSDCIPWCHSQQISTLLFFHQHHPIFFKLKDTEVFFIGIALNVGHKMAVKVLTDDIHKVICHSSVRHADDPKWSKLPNRVVRWGATIQNACQI